MAITLTSDVNPITANRDLAHPLGKSFAHKLILGLEWEGEMKTKPVLDAPGESQEDELRPIEAAKHVAGARHLLTSLRHKIGAEKHPELEEAITKLEVALSILTIKTGGML